MATTVLDPARPGAERAGPEGAGTEDLAPRGSRWFLLASVVLLLIGTGGLFHANTGGCCGAGPGEEPSRTAPVPEPWGADVLAAAEVSGLPPEIVAAQLDVESRWDPRAVSHAGAQGLAQFMPDTWRRYGRGDPFDPRAAIRAQGLYLKDLRRMVRGLAPASAQEEIDLVLAAYNAGPTAVLRYGGIPPFAETRGYVAQIRELAATTYAGVGA
ncbi:lytic transglycosylase domain-containing protein [Kocuria sp. NPDC057446]|uniref:lytic transglycosylase domain-containing protein n=1 Tax=Kocuria sp. NPDC057446 TaxID=3346137 RepID=UPI0036D00C33